MREIVLDTETTGLDPKAGHRIVEIGCVELINRIPTKNHLQYYINPERDVPQEASHVHGLTEDFLRDKPVFAAILDPLLDFIGDDPLIIHNADFDVGFLNWEFQALGREPLSRARIVDTLALARKKFPGGLASLDALCRRFNIDTSARTLHGALLDAQLLAEVYVELTGGRQTALGLTESGPVTLLASTAGKGGSNGQVREPRAHLPRPDELEAHGAFVKKIPNALWLETS